MTLLGASFPVSRLILGYPVLTGQALRYALAAAVLGALVRRGPRPGRRAVVRLVALATTGLVGFNICVLGALRHADAPLVGTVVGASPLVLALLGPALAGRRPAARLVGLAAVIVLGVALVEGGGHATPAGIAWALGALAGEALFSLLAAPLLPALGPVRISAWACALAVPLLLGAATLTGEWRHWRVPRAATRPRRRHHPQRPPAATARPAPRQQAAARTGRPAGPGPGPARPARARAGTGRPRRAPSRAPSPPS